MSDAQQDAEKRKPWLKFYPADWRADPSLRACSYAARGLWIDLIALMHDATEYGHLLVNGEAPAPKKLARMLGAEEKEIVRLLAELEAEGVFSRTASGTIYSRRMLRDHEKAKTDRVNGGSGGNPNLRKNKPGPDKPPHNGGDNPPLKGLDKPRVNGAVIPADKATHARVPEARGQRPGSPPSPPGGAAWNLVGVTPDPETGRPSCNGWLVDRAWERIAEAARIDAERWRSPLDQLVGWLRDGFEPDDIVRTVTRIAGRAGYRPPFSLAFFDRAVREDLAQRGAA